MTWGQRRSGGARRFTVVLLGAAGLMFGSAATAFACIEACMTKFGEVVWDGGDTYYEFEYCTERFNDRGGISTTCFYSEHEI